MQVAHHNLVRVTGQLSLKVLGLCRKCDFVWQLLFYGLESEAVKAMAFLLNVTFLIKMGKRLSCKRRSYLKSGNKCIFLPSFSLSY